MLDKNTLLAMVLCFLIFIGWQKYFIEPNIPPAETPQTQMQNTASGTSQTGGNATTVASTAVPVGNKKEKQTELNGPKIPEVPEQTRDLPLSLSTATVGNGFQFFDQWHLRDFAISLNNVTFEEGTLELAFDSREFLYLKNVRGNLTQEGNQIVWSHDDEWVSLKRTFTSTPDESYVDVDLDIQFKKVRPRYAFLTVNSQTIEDDQEAMDRQVGYFANEELTRVNLGDSIELDQTQVASPFIVAMSRYFVFTTVARGDFLPKALVQPKGDKKGAVSFVYPVVGDSVSIPIRTFFGQKDVAVLKHVDPRLESVVDFGWFTFFAYPILQVMKWFYQFTHNYGLAIILLTVLIKALMYPLTYKSMKSMRKMAELQPKVNKLREKYKDNREALNREMLLFMKSNGYNPMAGCWPILIQMPIFFALYRVLYGAVELYQAPFALWITDLSTRDPFYVTPILLAVTMFAQQKLTPNTATDPMQQKIMQYLPIIFGVMMLPLPAGLTLYMLVNAITSVIQQFFLNKKLGPMHVPTASAGAKG